MNFGDPGIAIGLSVVMHVAWNLIARHQARESEPLWWVLLGHLVLFGPWGFYALASQADWTPRLLGLLAVSAGAITLYFIGLQRAYVHAPVALVYPLVRSSPLLIALWSTSVLGESFGTLAWIGIGVSALGLAMMAATGRGHAEGRALPWTMLAMLATSVYSVADKAATSQIDGFGGLVGYLSVGYLAAWLAMSLRMHRETARWCPARRPGLLVLLAGSVCIGMAYALVIHAMRTLPAAEVVAYTNAGLVLATLLSLGVFRERAHWRQRLLGTGTICTGLACLAMGRMLNG